MEDQMLEIIKRFNVRNSDKRSRGEQGQHEKAGSYRRHVMSRGAKVGLAASLGAFASLCFAQSQTATASTSNVAQGPSIATCVACHGALGAGSEMGVPRLAGKNPEYLAHALSMFKAGTRVSPQMQAVAQNLSDSDMRALAVFFSNQHPPLVKAPQPPAPELVAAGKQLAEMGAGTSVLACFSCHAAGGKGNGARFPGIAGEPAAFTVARLHEFQARAKAAPPKAGTMTAVAGTLNDTQIEQVAAYLSVSGP
ncbi:c-type cytochrome [Paraburkholderia sp. RL17-347-BIC-D]|uniref:c-type cytochrome n=2 Tax=Paraburkholderia TaxID=1822464 RepID=UPI0038BA304C